MYHVAGEPPYSYQNGLKFFQEVRPHVEYLHIKDGHWAGDVSEYTFPGEGLGNVAEILREIKEHKMDIPISIEPHVAVVFHDPTVTTTTQERWDTFIRYGKDLVKMAGEAGIVFNS